MVQQKVTSEKVVQPHFERVMVTPGSLGKKFRLLTLAEDGVPNRTISLDRARSYARNWREGKAQKSFLVLHDQGDHYRVYDGQHRLTAISEYLGEAVEMGAVVYPREALPTVRERLELLDANYDGVAQKNSDRLRTRAGLSAWPAIFREYGLDFGYDRSMRHITWDSLLLARLRADNSHRTGRVNKAVHKGNASRAGGERAAIVSAWESFPEKDIRKTAEIMAWWTPIAQKVYAQERVAVVNSAAGLQFALLMRELNPPTITAITDLERRLLNTGRGSHAAPPLSGVSAKDIPVAILYLLTIANYRRDADNRAGLLNLRVDLD